MATVGFLFLVVVVLVGTSSSKPVDSDSEEYTVEISEFEPYEISYSGSVESSGISKREVSPESSLENEKKTFALSEIIEHIEDSLVESALDIARAVRNSNETLEMSKGLDTFSTTDHPLAKRSELDTTTDDPIVLIENVSTQKVPSVNGKPAHIAIDRVSVYVAPAGYLPMIPYFQLNKNDSNKSNEDSSSDEQSKVPNTTETLHLEKKDIHSSTDIDSTTDTTTIKISSASPIPATTKTSSNSSSSTIASPTSASSSSSAASTTAKTTVEELKEVEEELKEKVAEIQADPVILSARV